MYNFSIYALIRSLLPHFLWQNRMIVWLRCLLYPIILLYDEFIIYKDQKLLESKVTGQVEWLEWMLNDEYYHNGSTRYIYIEDSGPYNDEIHLYNLSELLAETYIFNTEETADSETYIFNSSEGTGGPDFCVWVPDSFDFDVNHMAGFIDKYKLAGTKFEIKTYSI